MKEKIIDFYNGIFAYDQPGLTLEPKELLINTEPDGSVKGSFVISSADERRIKGLVHTGIPGMTLLSDRFFARAARVEYTYQPVHLRAGECLEGSIWLETSAGEYRLPVKVQLEGGAAEEEEDRKLPVILAGARELQICRSGPGRREEWKAMREREAVYAEFQRVIERERTGACTGSEATARLRELTDRLKEIEPESALGPLADAWVMLREDRKKEAGWLLKKYEKTRLLQQKEVSVRAAFVYVNALLSGEEKALGQAVAQLQRFYQKYPENRAVTWFLLQMDPKLRDDRRIRYLVLERQFCSGVRNRLLYQEACALLREDTALFTRLDAFALQVFGWAAAKGMLTEELAQLIAVQATRLRRWSPLAARLLKTCYQIHPSKETAGAVCLIGIRGHRTDAEAFRWYERGVEWDAKITNLYEYFMYALPERYPKLLPRQVLLYFHYHNTLTRAQKTKFYCNLVRYGTPEDAACEEHRRQLQEFLLEQLKGRQLNESLAWLYGRCLLAETLDEELLKALADVLFLQKITCTEKRIRTVEVRHEQLQETVSVPLSGDCAYVPVYTKDAEITLVDEQGGRHRQSVAYERKRVMIEPGFQQLCTARLKDHLGLNLYLLDGEGRHRLKEENVSLVWRILEENGLRESWRQELKLELLEYERKRGRLEKPDERLCFSEAEALGLARDCQASYIESLILMREDDTALRLLWKSGCREADPRLLLGLLQRLLREGRYSQSLLLPLAEQVFREGLYTEQVVALLAGRGTGDTGELLALWKAGEQFGMSMPELEERILVQALFTEQHVCEAFPVFQAMEDRGGESVLKGAYLNYLSWLDFVKGQEVPEGLFDSLEHHLLWEDRLCVTAVLAYLKQLSVLLLLTDAQKRLAAGLLNGLSDKNRRFAFMETLYPYLDGKGKPWDRVVAEYRCNPEHKVVLHYVLEYHGKKTFDYLTERLYPVCGGVFTRSFVLFYGERLTWFITETAADGSEISTECRILENREEHVEGEDRYSRLCRMQQALDYRQERVLKKMMAEYEELSVLAEEKFRVR